MLRTICDILGQRAGGGPWCAVQMRRPAGLVWAVFRGGEPEPAAVARLYLGPGGLDGARCEARALRAIEPFAARLQAPRLLGERLTPDGPLLVESAVPGEPWLKEGQSAWGALSGSCRFRAAEAWLAEFQSAVPPCGTAAEAMHTLLGLLPSAVSNRTPEERELAFESQRQIRALASVPAVPVHGDFRPGNILQRRRGPRREHLSVIHWSCFHYGGPTEDLYNLITSAPAPGAGGSMESAWRIFFDSPGAGTFGYGGTVRALARWRLRPEAARPLFLLFLLDRLTRSTPPIRAEWRKFVALYVGAGMPAPFGLGPGITAASGRVEGNGAAGAGSLAS